MRFLRTILLLALAAAIVESVTCVFALLRTSPELRDEPFWFYFAFWASAGIGSIVAVVLEVLTNSMLIMTTDERRARALEIAQSIAERRELRPVDFWRGGSSIHWSVWFQVVFVAFLNSITFYSSAGALSAHSLLFR